MSTFDEAVVDIKSARDAIDGLVANQASQTKEVKHPDPTKHKYISFAKSGIRIIAGLTLVGGGWLEMNPYIQAAGWALVVAEVLGIAEELV